MSKRKIFISILFFGFPILLFIASYYYEFSNHGSIIYKKTNIHDSGAISSLLHSVSKTISFSISGDVKSRLSSNRFIIKNLKIKNNKTGNILIESYPFIKSEVFLYMMLP